MMSLSLLRQICQQPPPRIACQLASACFSTSSRKAQDTAFGWDKLLSRVVENKEIHTSNEERWLQHSESWFARYSTLPRTHFTGRSVAVHNGDVAGAARMLDKILARNSVARDWFTNRRHKQKGELRRRMKSIRWRRRFKHEVGEKVQLVQQIRRRGA
ncbi:uncharacterized protein FOMMEDRAFT_139209 [Fomitiporia mediterranea MF3/22]|uniref:uncharacterized protein n=1 Tax=Fomitiporia mediterranea (strain MF3/22) TaxID=694068 RepID=UPI0004407584|nr:uncharacterized protein FOMMEDRAFT_139209 [Fomitiporia mediterranea MF3/22]EJD05894.1 hypothetical protein FOMMEDRAFT_139209 [Fomitiporia mediterranea MF3/22]